MSGSVDVGTLRAQLGLDASKFEKGIAGAKHEIKGLAGELTNLMAPLAGLAAGFGIFELFKEFTRDGMAFAHTMETVGGVFRSTAEEIDKVTEAALNFAEKSSFSSQQIGRGFYYLASAGFSAAQAIEAMPTVLNLAKIGEMDIARATDVAVNAMRGMGLGVADLSRAADTMVGTFTRMNSTLDTLAESYTYVIPVGKAFGYSFEELNAILGVLSNSGVKGSMAGTQLAMAIQQANEVAIKLGFSSGDLIDVLEEMGKQGYTNADIMDMFGQRAGRAALILATQTKEARALADTLQTVGGEAEVLAARMSSSAKSSLGRLKGLWASLGDTVYKSYELQLVGVMEGTWAWLDKNRQAITGFLSGLMTFVTGLIGAFSSLGNIVASTMSSMSIAFGSVISKAHETNEAVAETAEEFAKAFEPPEMTDWDKAWMAIRTGWADVTAGIKGAIQAAGAMVAWLVRTTVEAFMNVSKASQAFMDMMYAGGKLVGSGFKDKQAFSDLMAARGQLSESLSGIKDDAKDAAQDFMTAIRQIDEQFATSTERMTQENQWAYEKGVPHIRQYLDLSRKEAEQFFADLQEENRSAMMTMGDDEKGLKEYKLELWNSYSERRREMLDQEIAEGSKKFGLQPKEMATLEKNFKLQLAEQRKLFFGGSDYSKPTILPKAGAEEDKEAVAKREKFQKDELATLRDLLKSADLSTEEMASVWSRYYSAQSEAIDSWKADYLKAGGDVVTATIGFEQKMRELMKEAPGFEKTYTMTANQEAAAAQDARAIADSMARGDAEDKKAEDLKTKSAERISTWVDTFDAGFTSISEATAGFLTTQAGEWSSFHDSLRGMLRTFIANVMEDLINNQEQAGAAKASVGFLKTGIAWLGNAIGGGGGGAGIDTNPIVDVTSSGGEMFAAAGGIFNQPTRAILGEQGPEAVIPLDRFRDPSFLSRLTGGEQGAGKRSSRPVVMNIQTQDAQSFKASASQITARMAVAMKQAERNL